MNTANGFDSIVTHPCPFWYLVNTLSVALGCRREDSVFVLRWHLMFLRKLKGTILEARGLQRVVLEESRVYHAPATRIALHSP